MYVMLPLTKGHLSNKDRIVWQKGCPYLKGDHCIYKINISHVVSSNVLPAHSDLFPLRLSSLLSPTIASTGRSMTPDLTPSSQLPSHRQSTPNLSMTPQSPNPVQRVPYMNPTPATTQPSAVR